MNELLSWKGTSLKIDLQENVESNFIKSLKNQSINLRREGNIYYLENQSKYFIYEDEFIDDSRRLPSIITKFIQKDYNNLGQVYIASDAGFIEIEADKKDKIIYEKIIKENNIDGTTREFPISINVLNEVLDSNNRKSALIIDFFILSALSTKISYTAEEIESEFIIGDKRFGTNFNIDCEPFYLFPIYDWIINNNEYKDSYIVKLQIVRQVIVNKRTLENTNEILEDSKLAYRRIISRKTDDYFEQINKLKDDFLNLSKNENNTLRTLNLTFFAWLGSLGVQLLNIIIGYNGNNLLHYLLFSKGSKKGIVVGMFIIALIFIFIAYVSEIKSLQKEYNVLKHIYKDKILFESESDIESKFELIIKKPEVGKFQMGIFGIFLFLLLVRCICAFM